jgi:chemotaxis signal transduction protein
MDATAGDAQPVPAEGTARAGGILLRLGSSRYAVDVAHVAEVVTVPVVTRVPGVPAWLTGVANWRGRLLPVLDVRSLLGAPVTPLASSARLLVLQDGDVTAGLLAEAVPGVYDVPLDVADPPPATLTGDAARLVSGQVGDDAGPIGVLDARAVLASRERLDRRRHGG